MRASATSGSRCPSRDCGKSFRCLRSPCCPARRPGCSGSAQVRGTPALRGRARRLARPRRKRGHARYAALLGADQGPIAFTVDEVLGYRRLYTTDLAERGSSGGRQRAVARGDSRSGRRARRRGAARPPGARDRMSERSTPSSATAIRDEVAAALDELLSVLDGFAAPDARPDELLRTGFSALSQRERRGAHRRARSRGARHAPHRGPARHAAQDERALPPRACGARCARRSRWS